MNIKSLLRYILNFIHFDITKNLEYDRLTKLIMRRVINNNSNCIDVGCHKGEILESILKYSPEGKHYAFEPIPYLFHQLEKKYKRKALIYPYALSDKAGESSFQFVKNAPAYSGIKKRKYDIAKPDIEEIKVELKTLDEIIPGDTKIDFINSSARWWPASCSIRRRRTEMRNCAPKTRARFAAEPFLRCWPKSPGRPNSSSPMSTGTRWRVKPRPAAPSAPRMAACE